MCFRKPPSIPKHLLILPEPVYYRRRPQRRPWAALVLLILTLGTLAGATSARAQTGETRIAQERAIDLYQAGTGSLLLKRAGAYQRALHLDSSANVTIKGMLAKVVLQQTFQNSGNDWVEAVYVFPLGETAAVSRMVMTVGERRIVAEVREKQEAQRIYQVAKSTGKRAALTEQERPNLFTQSIANIGPGETVVIELHFHETVMFTDNTFRWRLPTTLTPRYIPGGPTVDADLRTVAVNGWSLPSDQVTDAHRITPFMVSVASSPAQSETAVTNPTNPIRIKIHLEAGLPLAQVRGTYHPLQLTQTGDVQQAVTVPEVIPMDRDFEIAWQPITGHAPLAAVFVEEVAGDDYALLMVVPPEQQLQQALPREVIFIIDTSGSMSGSSILQAKASLQLALSRLQEQDRFNLIEFNSYHRALFAEPQTADLSNLQQAQDFVGRLQAQGGTEMAPALQAALSAPSTEGYLKQVIFITDGSVGNEATLFELIHNQLGDARLFTVGIGSAPNSHFMRKAAQFGRGTFTYVGSQTEVAERMQELFAKLESPVLGDIEIDWPVGVEVEAWPQRLPDLYQGEPLLISARVSGKLPEQARLQVRGQQARQPWSRALEVKQSNTISAGVAVRWARSKIDALLDSLIRGRPLAEVRAEVLPLAITHQLLSPFTSFIAVEEEISRPSGDPVVTEPVPNLAAQGQTVPAAIAYPQTATPARLQLLLGWLMLLAWLACHWRTRSGFTCAGRRYLPRIGDRCA